MVGARRPLGGGDVRKTEKNQKRPDDGRAARRLSLSRLIEAVAHHVARERDARHARENGNAEYLSISTARWRVKRSSICEPLRSGDL